jgi:C4-dicarboxylate-specific signal transduction histidine kinase
MSLSLRFGFYAIVLLLAAVLTASYLFDGERSAILELNEREHVRLHAERAADELLRNIEDLRKDTLFLAGTPPLQEIRRALREAPHESLDSGTFADCFGRLERLFLAFGTAHPGYFRLRLIANGDNGRELVRVDRQGERLVAVRGAQLQDEGDRYYFRAARRLRDGEVMLSPIDLSRARARVGVPEQTTLRAVAPLAGPDGAMFAMLVLTLDMGQVFDRLARYVPSTGRLYVVDDDGYFLQHPDPAKRMGFERAQPYRIEQEFPQQTAPIKALTAGATRHFDVTHGREAALAYATLREIDGGGGSVRRLTLILSEPLLEARGEIASARRKSYATIGLLLGVTAGFAVFLANRLTRSLRALVGVSHALARGNYNVEVPQSPERDLQKLTAAFRHMIEALRQREHSLTSINQSLEDKVRQRTRELSESQAALSREQAMMHSIVDHVGDGVVAVDAEGNLLLCNNNALKLLGAQPDAVPPEAWSRHFGLCRSATGDPLGSAESFIVRALNGETVRNEEVFVRNAGQPDGRWISVFARPLGGGHPPGGGAVAVLVDIHETRQVRDQRNAQLQELAQIGRLALIGQIIDTTTHRLSQPLAAIANYAGAAIQMRSHDRLDDRRLGEILEHISRLAERAGEALLALRTLTPRGGRPVGEVDINAATSMALELLADLTQRDKITVERRLAADLPTVTGRRAELQQAIIHLVMNAIEALETADGDTERRMLVGTACDAARRHLKITVCDNGPGIAPAQREQIFEPWYTTKTAALGLGLAVVRSVVEAHNGSLRIDDMEEDMTCFVIDLPVGGEDHG